MTMANPRSLGWGLEMYGYGILGVATTVAAPLFESRGGQRVIRFLFIINNIGSMAAAASVLTFPGWLLTPNGMIDGAAWNLRVIVTMGMVIREFGIGRSSKNQQSAIHNRKTE